MKKAKLPLAKMANHSSSIALVIPASPLLRRGRYKQALFAA
jgi:hypothetical protein